MEKVFETDLNVKGGYAVNLYALGVPQTTVVDDIIPYHKGKPVFAGVSNDNSLWPIILEKAFAKMQGNYFHISGGLSYMGVRYMNGAPWEIQATMYMTSDQIWDYISTNLSAGNTMTCGSTSGSDTNKDAWGVVKGHAYTISKIHKLNDGTRLVRARNPWGRDSYMGEYGSESP